jgi:hypothetical protein
MPLGLRLNQLPIGQNNPTKELEPTSIINLIGQNFVALSKRACARVINIKHQQVLHGVINRL